MRYLRSDKMPIMMINGKFLILDDDYNLDFRGSIRNSIMNELTEYSHIFGFTYENTKSLVESVTDKVIETIEFYKEQEKSQNKHSRYMSSK